MRNRVLLGALLFCSVIGSFFAFPVNAAVGLKTLLVHELSAKPGSSIDVVFEMINTGEDGEPVEAFLLDRGSTEEGGMAFFPPNTLTRSCAPWITLIDTDFRMLPQETREYRYSINVPEDVREPGSYWTTLAITVTPPSVGPITNRYAYYILVMVNIGDGRGVTRVNPVITGVTRDGTGKADAKLSLQVSGEWARCMGLRWKVTDISGVMVAEGNTPARWLLPGFPLPVDLPLPHVEPGVYRLILVGEEGVIEISGDALPLMIPE